ncbi:MAG: hypothetical protein ACK4WC_06140 [Rubrimonas sp.]
MATDPWHFSRTVFRDLVFDALLKSGADALRLFGPRRMGKTEFLLRDVAPEAARRRLPWVYASFWQSPQPPASNLHDAIERALASKGGVFSLEGFRRLNPKLRIQPMGIGGEVDLAGEGGRPAAAEIALDDALERLGGSAERPALLLLDEVQALAGPEHAPFIAALRTSLDKRRPRVKAIFTGSSLTGLRAMFDDRQAPFFHYGAPIDMPPLGEDFVDAMRAAHRNATGRDVDRAAAVAFFEEAGRSPYVLRRALEQMALRPDMDFAAARVFLLDELAERMGYREAWAKLSPLQRLLMVRIARGGSMLTAAEALAEYAAALGSGTVSKGAVSSALGTLSRRGLIHRLMDEWRMVDPEMARFIRDAAAGDA